MTGKEANIDLRLIEKQFLCCTPLNKFNWHNSNNGSEITMTLDKLSPEIQKKILEKTVNHNLVKNYPIKKSYQRSFLKLLINELEKNSQEIEDDVYNSYCSLVSSNDDQQNSTTQYRHFLYENNSSRDIITLQESISIVSLGTTGLCTWQAALGLSEWCIANKKLLNGKKVLELGCGVGLTGLAIIQSCNPREYTFSDVHTSVLKMLCKNIKTNLKSEDENDDEARDKTDLTNLRINYNGVKVEAIRLPWEEIGDSSPLENINSLENFCPDIILAADVLYDDECFDSLARALNNLLKSNGDSKYAVIAATVRNIETIEKFLKMLESYDLVFKELEIPEKKYFIHTDETPIRIIKIVFKL